jgi:hypothetical protein
LLQNHKYGTTTSKIKIKTKAFSTMEQITIITFVTPITVVVIAKIDLIETYTAWHLFSA